MLEKIKERISNIQTEIESANKNVLIMTENLTKARDYVTQLQGHLNEANYLLDLNLNHPRIIND